MLAKGEGSNDFAGSPKADLLIALAHRIVARIGHPVTVLPFAPRIYSWASELSSGYHSVHLGIKNLRWSQELLSRVWSMQPLSGVTPYLWPPLARFTWFPPEWRYLARMWPPKARARGDFREPILFEASQDLPNLVTYPAYWQEEASFPEEMLPLYDTPEDDALRPNPLALSSTIHPLIVAKVLLPLVELNSTRQKDFAPPNLWEGHAGGKFMGEDIRSAGFTSELADSTVGLPLKAANLALPAFTAPMAHAMRAMPSRSLDPQLNRMASEMGEKGHAKPITARWQAEPQVFVPRTLRADRSIGEMPEQRMLPKATSREVELPELQLAYLGERSLPGVKFENTASAWLDPVSPQLAAMRHEDMPLSPDSPSLVRIPGLRSEGKEAKARFPQLKAVTSISTKFHHWLKQAEAQDTGVPAPSQLRESAFHTIVDRTHAFGITPAQRGVTTNRNPLAEQPFSQETSRDWHWGARYAEPLSLSLAAQAPVNAWDSTLVNVLALGELGQNGMEQTPSAFGAAHERANLALAPLARPQRGGNPSSPSPNAETSALLEEGQMGEVVETDLDALARDVYKLIKHRLLREKVQAQSMV